MSFQQNSAPSSVGAENVTNFTLAPGETGVYGQRFLASLAAPYLKAEMMCSTTRFVYKVPNTLLGIIPIGAQENTIPIKSISAVSTNKKFKLGRAVLAIIFLILAIYMGGSSILGAVIAFLIACLFAVTVVENTLVVVNHAGGTHGLGVCVIDGAKLEAFKQELQGRVFADAEQTRHNEAQNLRQQQLMAQQMQAMMQQQQMQQQAQQQAQQPQPNQTQQWQQPQQPQ